MMPRPYLGGAHRASLVLLALVLALALTGPRCGGNPPAATVDDGTEVDDTTWQDTGFSFRNRIGQVSGQSHALGMRFEANPLGLSQGQQVAYARLILPATGDGDVDVPLPMEIVGLDVDEVAPFTTTRPSQNPTTLATASWTLDQNWPGFTQGETYSCVPLRRYSPDISPIVNEILARPGWGAGAEPNLGIVVRDANLPATTQDNFVTVQDTTGFGSCNNNHSARLEIYPTLRDAFVGKEILGRVTDTTVTINAASLLPVDVYFEWDTTIGGFANQTPVVAYVPGATEPAVIEVELTGLAANTEHYYRMRYRKTGDPTFEIGPTRRFHTQRPPESSFRFAVMADSHLQNRVKEHNTDSFDLYGTALANIFTDLPDFLIDLGDTFHTEFVQGRNVEDLDEAKHRYLDQRIFLDELNHSVPLFLVLGNHEGEFGWELDGSAENLAVWSTKARQEYYPNPIPNSFYSGDPTPYPHVGVREAVYAFEWGDALFVSLDPYWETLQKPHDIGGPATGDRWDWTLGPTQYFWLQFTLSTSPRRFKFVFAHQVTGGVTDYGRGGIKAARHAIGGSGSYEWGGEDVNGNYTFASERPAWNLPIHDLMVTNDVTAFFHGHDHVYVMEELDGIVYQEVPQPSNPSYNKGFPENAQNYVGDRISNSGHLRVDVTPTKVTVDYVRAFLPGEGVNQSVEVSWSVYDCNRNGVRDAKEGIVCECQNGIDDDGDGLIDHGNDPGCDSIEDLTETSPLLVCDNGLDDDGDTLIDYPSDPGCDDPGFDALETSPALVCDNGLDDDGDTVADFPSDPGCDDAGTDSSEKSATIACDNGIDDDTDTLTDFPADLDCKTPGDLSETPDCGDALDNDGDGLTDFPADPGCVTSVDGSERGTVVCDNGIDDDGDALADFPSDPGCGNALDTNERSPAFICDNGLDDDSDMVSDFPADLGCNDIADPSEESDCNDGMDNDADGQTDFPADLGCDDLADGVETSPILRCDNGVDDDADGLTDHPADPGCNHPLDNSEFDPSAPCDDGIDNDSDSFVDFPTDPECLSPTDSSEKAACNDGVDNDSDGEIDHPSDPECASAQDLTEEPDCSDGIDNDGDGDIDHPTDAQCDAPGDLTELPACSDGIDNDGDGDIDHPADAGCGSAADLSELSFLLVCDNGVDDDGDTFTDHPSDPGCTSTSDPDEKSLALPCDNNLDEDADGKIDYPQDPECISPSDLTEIADCSDTLDNDIDFTVDFPSDPGCSSSLDLTEQPDCSDGIDNDGDGDVDHPADVGCDGPGDLFERSNALVCDDGDDDDGDGLADFPDDPGCDDTLDPDERSPALICDNGIDDDGDTLIDHPADPECNSLLDPSEGPDCNDGLDNDADSDIDFPADTHCNDANDPTERPDCVDGLDNDGDGLTDFPADPGCTASSDMTEKSAALVCDNGLDDDGDTTVDYPADPGCTGPTEGDERGVTACDDGIDNDSDLQSDYPADLECTGPGDLSETPDCGDGLDNDGDGSTDWGSGLLGDPGCASTGDLSERDPSMLCDDGIDNDGDGRMDFDPVTQADAPSYSAGFGDPGCGVPLSATESPQCQDGISNDIDGMIDFDGGLAVLGAGHPNLTAPDPQCGTPWKNKEKVGCGLGFELAGLLPLLAAWRRRRLSARG